jgi:hypothetical protein
MTLRMAATAALLLASPIVAQVAFPGSETIAQQSLKADLAFLASDDMRGRMPTTGQNAIAAAWIRSRFERNGFAPAGGNGSYYFPFEIVAPALDTPNDLAVTVPGAPSRALSLRDDFYPLRFSATGQATGEVVFVGFGAAAPALGYSDYRGTSVRGRIVLALDHDPGEHDPASRFDGVVSSQHGTQQWKTLAAQEAGATAILFVSDIHNHAETPALSVTAAGVWPVTPPRAETHLLADWVNRIRIPAAQISVDVAEQLLRGTGQTLGALARKAETTTGLEPMPLPQSTVTLRTSVRRQLLPDRNVIAVLPGADPALRDEIVMVSAHLDHIGAAGDEIFNGADDNASGVAGLLAIADAWARAVETGNRPRRSLVFAAWNSEEVGLLGAWAYTERPTFPLDRTVAVLNMDMIGRSEEVPAGGGPRFAGLEPQTRQSNRNAVNVIGTARSQDMARVVSASNSAGMDIRFRYDNNASNLMRRSDHWPFLQRGVPALWFHTGLHPDYHLVSDRAERIEYDKLEAVTRLVFRTSWTLAQGAARPVLVAP